MIPTLKFEREYVPAGAGKCSDAAHGAWFLAASAALPDDPGSDSNYRIPRRLS